MNFISTTEAVELLFEKGNGKHTKSYLRLLLNKHCNSKKINGSIKVGGFTKSAWALPKDSIDLLAKKLYN